MIGIKIYGCIHYGRFIMSFNHANHAHAYCTVIIQVLFITILVFRDSIQLLVIPVPGCYDMSYVSQSAHAGSSIRPCQKFRVNVQP